MQYPITCSCQCGQVKYTLLEKPAMVLACHCNECQILSTSNYSITSVIAADKIQFEGQMKDWSRKAESGNTSAAKFCPECGNRIYHFNPNEPEKLKLKLKPSIPTGCPDFKPQVHIWTCQKMDWFTVPKDVKQLEKQP